MNLGGRGGVSGVGASVAGAGKGLTALLGRGSLIGGAILAIVVGLNSFKQVISIAKNILKLGSELLRPIADVITLLLLPILQILKPILLVVRQIMAPFRQLAFRLSREGVEASRAGDTGRANELFGLSIAAGLSGVGAVFSFFFKDVLKLFIDGIGGLFGPILSFFGINVDKAIQFAKDAIDFGAAVLISKQTAAITNAASQLGVDVTTEYGKVNDVLSNLFIGDENSFKGTFEAFTAIMENEVQNNLASALDSLVGKFNNAANEINAIQVRGSSGGGGASFTRSIARSAVSRFASPFPGLNIGPR